MDGSASNLSKRSIGGSSERFLRTTNSKRKTNKKASPLSGAARKGEILSKKQDYEQDQSASDQHPTKGNLLKYCTSFWFQYQIPYSSFVIFRIAFFLVFAIDKLTELSTYHKYGVNDFNVPHFSFFTISGFPNASAMNMIGTLTSLISIRIATGKTSIGERMSIAGLACLSYFCSQINNYQHHYLLCSVLIIFSTLDWAKTPKKEIRHRERARANSLEANNSPTINCWQMRLLQVTVSMVYFWTVVAKLNYQWCTGELLPTMLGPVFVNAVENIAPFFGFSSNIWSFFSVGTIILEIILCVHLFGTNSEKHNQSGLSLVIWFSGILMHITMQISGLKIGYFSYYMVLFYLLWMPHFFLEITVVPIFSGLQALYSMIFRFLENLTVEVLMFCYFGLPVLQLVSVNYYLPLDGIVEATLLFVVCNVLFDIFGYENTEKNENDQENVENLKSDKNLENREGNKEQDYNLQKWKNRAKATFLQVLVLLLFLSLYGKHIMRSHYMDKAHSDYSMGRHQATLEGFQSLTKFDPHYDEAFSHYGFFLQLMGQNLKALDAYKAAKNLNSNNLKANVGELILEHEQQHLLNNNNGKGSEIPTSTSTSTPTSLSVSICKRLKFVVSLAKKWESVLCDGEMCETEKNYAIGYVLGDVNTYFLDRYHC